MKKFTSRNIEQNAIESEREAEDRKGTGNFSIQYRRFSSFVWTWLEEDAMELKNCLPFNKVRDLRWKIRRKGSERNRWLTFQEDRIEIQGNEHLKMETFKHFAGIWWIASFWKFAQFCSICSVIKCP